MTIRPLRTLVTAALTVTLTAAVVLAAAPSSSAAEGRPEFGAGTRRALDAIVMSALRSSTTPGIAVGIWDPERGTYVRAFGSSDVEHHTALDVGDHVRIASVTKTFTAMRVLQLVDEQRLTLGAHLDEFVPGIAHGDTITVAQLLNMTAGVFDYTQDERFTQAYVADPTGPFGPEDVLEIIASHEPAFAPGADIQYSNSNYVLLQLIVEKVTNRSLGENIQRNILDPVGLTNTSYPTTETLPAPFSSGYLVQPMGGPRDVTLSNPGYSGGAGAMISNLRDLRRWGRTLATGTLLSPALHRQQLEFRTMAEGTTTMLEYGLGVSRLNGFLGHNGGSLGYSDAVFHLPSARATIVVEANADNLDSTVATAVFLALASYLYPEQFPRGV